MTAELLKGIREEVIGILFNRYVFRTHQEIVRLNSRLQGRPRSIFAEWAWIVYAVANAMAVRRLASDSYEDGDVNFVRLLDIFIRDPAKLWTCFERNYSDDATVALAAVAAKATGLEPGWHILACKRLIGEDRKALINAAEKANQFASKRAAHSVPDTRVNTTFSDLDDAIDTIKELTEKYTLLVCSEMQESLEPAHRAGAPTIYTWLDQVKNLDLLKEMKSRKLPTGWDAIFLEAWATPEIISLDLGEMRPPLKME